MNPVSYARMLSTTSITKLAKEVRVSKQYISRLEQGIYEKPNKALMEWSAKELNKHYTKPISAGMVAGLYQKWQWEKRENNKDNRGLQPITITKFDRVSQKAQTGSDAVIYYHQIFAQWMNSYWDSAHSFCVDMCLHPSPVAEYIEGRTHTMPNKLAEVLMRLELIGEGFKTDER